MQKNKIGNLDIATIAQRSVRGVFFLSAGQIVNNILFFVLTLVVDPRAFGVFIVVSAVLSILTYFSDIGLAAALVQKEKEVTHDDLRTTFTIQLILVLVLITGGFFATPFVAQFYGLDIKGIQLFQALIVSFFLSSLKTIPSIILERNLQFGKWVIPQVLENFALNIVAVALTIQGFGITSFAYAVLARGVVGVVSMYLISPWKVSLGLSKDSLKKLFTFGVPFQTNSILALIKDDLLIIILGKILTFTEVSYIGFAKKWAFAPLRLLMDKIIKVTFPTFSRLQKDPTSLKLAIEKTLFSLSVFIFPATIGIAVVAPYAIDAIPKYNRWEQALPSITFFAINAMLSSISTPLTNILNAIGKVRITFYFMLFWTAATWILTLVLIQLMGFVGVSMAAAIIASSVVVVVYMVRKFIAFDIFKPIRMPFLASIIMGTTLYFLSPLFVTDIPTLILAIVLGAGVYFGILFAVSHEEMKSNLRILLKHLRYSS